MRVHVKGRSGARWRSTVRHPFRTVLAGLTLTAAAVAPVAPQSAVTIRAGTLLDGRGGMRRNVDVVVQAGTIRSIEAAGTRAPDYDLSRYTIMPGGIDTHVHINWHFDADGKTHHTRDESPEQAMLYAAGNAWTTLMGGITTVQSVGSTIDGPLRDAIARGDVPGPRILTSLRQMSERSGTPAELREMVRSLKADGADVVKIFASASIRDGGEATMSQDQLDAACGEARAQGLRTVVHAHGPESARRATLAGCTTIEHGVLLDDATLDFMAEKGIWYDPNIGLVLQNYLDNRAQFEGVGNYNAEGFAYMERAVPQALDVFRRALRRPKLRTVFGTDAVAGAHGRTFEEIVYRVRQGGQPARDAIISATSLAAESLGMADRIGALAAGMQSDLIALDGNPQEDITALRRPVFVMKGGTVFRHVAPSQASMREP
jgi:imidazolonepropionase-like amidohydrolase